MTRPGLRLSYLRRLLVARFIYLSVSRSPLRQCYQRNDLIAYQPIAFWLSQMICTGARRANNMHFARELVIAFGRVVSSDNNLTLKRRRQLSKSEFLTLNSSELPLSFGLRKGNSLCCVSSARYQLDNMIITAHLALGVSFSRGYQTGGAAVVAELSTCRAEHAYPRFKQLNPLSHNSFGGISDCCCPERLVSVERLRLEWIACERLHPGVMFSRAL